MTDSMEIEVPENTNSINSVASWCDVLDLLYELQAPRAASVLVADGCVLLGPESNLQTGGVAHDALWSLARYKEEGNESQIQFGLLLYKESVR